LLSGLLRVLEREATEGGTPFEQKGAQKRVHACVVAAFVAKALAPGELLQRCHAVLRRVQQSLYLQPTLSASAAEHWSPAQRIVTSSTRRWCITHCARSCSI
jgi:hypothetical protein